MKNENIWHANLVELIRRTSSDLPVDVDAALKKAHLREKRNSAAYRAIDIILQNIKLARVRRAPLCQDTGNLLFYICAPKGFDIAPLHLAIYSAVREATHKGILRQNTMDSLTGNTCAMNIGKGMPVIHIDYARRKTIDIRLILKGGGCENVSAQYSLPDMALHAGRDIDGVRRCLLNAVLRAQGNGCPPAVLGVCIGGDRATGADFAKRQLLRKIDDSAPERKLAQLEKRIFREANASYIGPMGFGGATTLLAVKIGALSRLPASYFVSVSYMCWAFRRRGMILQPDGYVHRWLY
jgi:fumarate hydratase class I